MKTDCKMLERTNLSAFDKANIISAFETDNPKEFFRIHDRYAKDSNLHIDDFFDILVVNTDLGRYIDAYVHQTTRQERERFWLRYRDNGTYGNKPTSLRKDADFYEVIAPPLTVHYAPTEEEGRRAFEEAIRKVKNAPNSDWKEVRRYHWEDCREGVELYDRMNNRTLQIFLVARMYGPVYEPLTALLK